MEQLHRFYYDHSLPNTAREALMRGATTLIGFPHFDSPRISVGAPPPPLNGVTSDVEIFLRINEIEVRASVHFPN